MSWKVYRQWELNDQARAMDRSAVQECRGVQWGERYDSPRHDLKNFWRILEYGISSSNYHFKVTADEFRTWGFYFLMIEYAEKHQEIVRECRSGNFTNFDKLENVIDDHRNFEFRWREALGISEDEWRSWKNATFSRRVW